MTSDAPLVEQVSLVGHEPAAPGGGAAAAKPLTAAECAAVIAGLRDGSLVARDVQQRIIAAVANKRLWTTPEWKQLRDRLLKDVCEQCGATEPPFVLQHFRHPLTVTQRADVLYGELQEAEWAAYAVEHADDPEAQDRYVPEGEPRRVCPKCGGYSHMERTSAKALATMTRFRCQTIRHGDICHHEFDEEILGQPIKLQYGHERLWRVFKVAFAPIYQARKDAMLLEATIKAVEDFAAYMSGEGTRTFCQACAFKWDKKGMRLCEKCRDGWHAHRYPTCLACASGTTWMTCASCGAKHLRSQARCYACGRETAPADD